MSISKAYKAVLLTLMNTIVFGLSGQISVAQESEDYLSNYFSSTKYLLLVQSGSLQRGSPQDANTNTRGETSQSGSSPSTPQGAILQRGSQPASSTAKNEECQRRHAEWERNLAVRSLFWGFILSIFILSVLTAMRFSNSVIRLFCSIVLAGVFGPFILGLQKYDLFKVCPEPPSLLGVFSADLFLWTLLGIGVSVSLIAIIRYVTVVRTKFRTQQITS
jgi:hypothetical protein